MKHEVKYQELTDEQLMIVAGGRGRGQGRGQGQRQGFPSNNYSNNNQSNTIGITIEQYNQIGPVTYHS